jgi:hypothetical protein
MTEQLNLTEKETAMLQAFVQSGVDINGSTCAEDMTCDNMTYMNADDLQEDLGWSKQEIGGVMSALDSKAIISDMEESYRGAKINDWIANNHAIEWAFENLKFK